MVYFIALSLAASCIGLVATLASAHAGLRFRADPQPTRAGAIRTTETVAAIGTWLLLGGAIGLSASIKDQVQLALASSAPDWMITAGIWLGPFGLALTIITCADGLARRLLGKPAENPVPLRKNFGAHTPWFVGHKRDGRYQIFITDDMLCGARIGSAYIDSESVPDEAREPRYWVRTLQATLYQRLDVTSRTFLTLDERNFHMRWSEIGEVEYAPKRRWLQPAVPNSGRLILRLRDGTKCEFLLLGDQDAEKLRNMLDAIVHRHAHP